MLYSAGLGPRLGDPRRLRGLCELRPCRLHRRRRLHRRPGRRPVLRPSTALAAAARPARRRRLLRRPGGADRLSDPAPARHLLRHRHAGRQPRLRRGHQQHRLLPGLDGPQLPADRAGEHGTGELLLRALSRGRRSWSCWSPGRSAAAASAPGLLSIREDEDTARMLGVPTERYKRLAFVISAVLTGMMGVIYAHSLGYITTDSVYRDDTNLSLIVYSLLGGMGTLFGPVIGAFLLVFITQVILGRLLDFHLFATGLLLVILVLAAPGGVRDWLTSAAPTRAPRHDARPSCTVERPVEELPRPGGDQPTCPSRSRPARSPASSAPTAPASRRCSTWSPAICRRPPARSGSRTGASPAWRPTASPSWASPAPSRSPARSAISACSRTSASARCSARPAPRDVAATTARGMELAAHRPSGRPAGQHA